MISHPLTFPGCEPSSPESAVADVEFVIPHRVAGSRRTRGGSSLLGEPGVLRRALLLRLLMGGDTQLVLSARWLTVWVRVRVLVLVRGRVLLLRWLRVTLKRCRLLDREDLWVGMGMVVGGILPEVLLLMVRERRRGWDTMKSGWAGYSKGVGL